MVIALGLFLFVDKMEMIGIFVKLVFLKYVFNNYLPFFLHVITDKMSLKSFICTIQNTVIMLQLISDANVEYVFSYTVKLGYSKQKIHFLVLNNHFISYICLTVITNSRL